MARPLSPAASARLGSMGRGWLSHGRPAQAGAATDGARRESMTPPPTAISGADLSRIPTGPAWMYWAGGRQRVEIFWRGGDLWYTPPSGYPQLVSTVPDAHFAPLEPQPDSAR